MTDGAMLAEILEALEIPCDKFSFHGKLDALAAGLGIDTEGRLLGDVLDDIAAKEGIQRDNRLYGAFIRKLYDYVTNGEDVTLTGNPLVLANSMGRPLKECVVSWEPTQEGEGTPSPDNIRPIHGRTQVKVERCGENLLPYIWDRIPSQVTRDSLTIVKTSEGTIHVTGTKTGTNWTDIFRISLASSEIFEIPAGTYSWGVGVSLQSNYGNMHSSPFTIDTPRIITGAYAAVNAAGTYNNDYIPALVAGSELPTKVEPYQGESNVLTLPREVYGAEVDIIANSATETWVKQTLDGTEKWNQRTSSGYFSYSLGLPTRAQTGICSHYKRLLYEAIRPNNPTGETGCYLEYSASAIFNVPFETLADWTAFLAAQYDAGTPVEIAYMAVTPSALSVTGGGTIPTVKGTNTLLSDADTIKATYRCNVRAAEQEINALYTDLLNEVEE